MKYPNYLWGRVRAVCSEISSNEGLRNVDRGMCPVVASAIARIPGSVLGVRFTSAYSTFPITLVSLSLFGPVSNLVLDVWKTMLWDSEFSVYIDYSQRRVL